MSHEQEPREHLATAATGAAEPRLDREEIPGTIRRRRGWIMVVAAAGLAAVIALAVTIPLALGGAKPGPAFRDGVPGERLSCTSQCR